MGHGGGCMTSEKASLQPNLKVSSSKPSLIYLGNAFVHTLFSRKARFIQFVKEKKFLCHLCPFHILE